MPPRRTYGRRKNTATAAADAIFGTAPSPARAPLADLTSNFTNIAIAAEEEEEDIIFESHTSSENGAATAVSLLANAPPPPRAPLADLTFQFSNVGLAAEEEPTLESDASSENGAAAAIALENATSPLRASPTNRLFHPATFEVGPVSDSSSESEAAQEEQDEYSAEGDLLDAGRLSSADIDTLKPLIDAYKADRKEKLPIGEWQDELGPGTQVVKIAEASYAEVYRVSAGGNSSIIKVMQLKIPSDPASSNRWTAVSVEQVVSEIRLMHALTVVPGFVTFKGARLIQGKPSNDIIRAYEACPKWNPATGSSEFPHPNTATNTSLFLLIELGDAGTTLDDAQLMTIQEVWDILIGVIVALTLAEINFKFEVGLPAIHGRKVLTILQHRDLHENNICILVGQCTAIAPSTQRNVYGSSGYKITLLDYGLSRATLENGDEVFYDLENDLGVFRGRSGHAQYDTYRRYVASHTLSPNLLF